jgi:sensor histidine kinase YesM
MNIGLKIILHLFFWIVYFMLSGIISFELSSGIGFMSEHLAIYLSGLLWAAIAFYSFYFFLYQYIEKHLFLRYFFLSIIAVIFLSGIFISIYRVFVFNDTFTMPLSWNFTSMAGTYVIANCGSLLRGFIGWIESSKQKAEMEKRNLQLELDALRSQVNPHFLFNTLNNIDALILSQPQKASAMLITLSDVMRYMLYQTQDKTVTLDMEIKHLQNVIALHRIRFAQPEYIQFDCMVTHRETNIVPLLFLPFVENACKFAHFKKTLPVIHISLQQQQNSLTFTCSNTFDANAIIDNQNGGIGLENVKKRLNMLYPENHSLEIVNDGNRFIVTLVIQLL